MWMCHQQKKETKKNKTSLSLSSFSFLFFVIFYLHLFFSSLITKKNEKDMSSSSSSTKTISDKDSPAGSKFLVEDIYTNIRYILTKMVGTVKSGFGFDDFEGFQVWDLDREDEENLGYKAYYREMTMKEVATGMLYFVNHSDLRYYYPKETTFSPDKDYHRGYPDNSRLSCWIVYPSVVAKDKEHSEGLHIIIIDKTIPENSTTLPLSRTETLIADLIALNRNLISAGNYDDKTLSHLSGKLKELEMNYEIDIMTSASDPVFLAKLKLDIIESHSKKED